MKKRTARAARRSEPVTACNSTRTAVDWKRLQSDIRGLKLLTHLQLQLIRNLEHVTENALRDSPDDEES